MRIVIKKAGWLRPRFRSLAWITTAVVTILLVAGTSVFTYYYVRFSRIIDHRFQGSVFPNVSQIYAAPERVHIGDKDSVADLVGYLRSAGFSENSENPKGSYTVLPDGVRIQPGTDSYFAEEPAEIRLTEGQVSSIVSLKDQTARTEYSMEPLLVTNLFDRTREKRRLVAFKDLPPNLVNAVVAIEDRRFFQHSGVDYLRIIKAAYVDLRSGRVRQGASTITQQLARSLFLSTQRTWKRKLEEALLTFQLERRLSKQQIFEDYCNTVYLGQSAGFSVSGFGEASQVYFGKDVRNLTLPEAALLAGIIQSPAFYSPYRHPEAALRRRNLVLESMVETGAITEKEKGEAAATPIRVVPSYETGNEAPYFVDMVRDQLLRNYSEDDLVSGSYHIYTTLDLRLQRAAVEAMRIGMAEVDQRLAALNKARQRRTKAAQPAQPQPPQEQAEAAMVVLDPHTGAVKALLGGRDYGRSQLNRVLAKRQPGSSFKPFVYATAFSAALNGAGGPVLTPVSMVEDEPTTFTFDGKTYEPANFKNEYKGNVTLREALANSLNVATVKVAEMVGYQNIVDLARRAGLNMQIQPTPAIALGAYEVMPFEIAGAYTIFANQGIRMNPYLVSVVRDKTGLALEQIEPKPTPVLDPRVAFLMTSLMEGVIDHGTGEGVRQRGFMLPASGKTGTSHDGWFAGYTSNLLCIVWVGYDSNKELPLSGALSALPIWTEFMKRATAIPEYHQVTAPQPPPGVVMAEIDPESGGLATPNCPKTQMDYFIEGTQPTTYCPIHNLQRLPRVAGLEHIANAAPPVLAPQAPAASQHPGTATGPPGPVAAATPPPPEQEKPKKHGFFGRIIGILKGSSDNNDGR